MFLAAAAGSTVYAASALIAARVKVYRDKCDFYEHHTETCKHFACAGAGRVQNLRAHHHEDCDEYKSWVDARDRMGLPTRWSGPALDRSGIRCGFCGVYYLSGSRNGVPCTRTFTPDWLVVSMFAIGWPLWMVVSAAVLGYSYTYAFSKNLGRGVAGSLKKLVLFNMKKTPYEVEEDRRILRKRIEELEKELGITNEGGSQ